MRRPRDAHENGHLPLIEHVEQPLRWDMVCSDRVGPERLHSRQIITNAFPRGKRLTVAGWGKRTIGQPSEPHPLSAPSEQLAVNANATIRDVCHHEIR